MLNMFQPRFEDVPEYCGLKRPWGTGQSAQRVTHVEHLTQKTRRKNIDLLSTDDRHDISRYLGDKGRRI